MKERDLEKHSLKKDRYSRIRGGSSRFFDIFCSTCNGHIILYQKDGNGRLLRVYLDRIFAPSIFTNLQFKSKNKKTMSNLQCPACKENIGIPMLYGSEKRLAFRLISGSFSRKNSEGHYPLR